MGFGRDPEMGVAQMSESIIQTAQSLVDAQRDVERCSESVGYYARALAEAREAYRYALERRAGAMKELREMSRGL